MSITKNLLTDKYVIDYLNFDINKNNLYMNLDPSRKERTLLYKDNSMTLPKEVIKYYPMSLQQRIKYSKDHNFPVPFKDKYSDNYVDEMEYENKCFLFDKYLVDTQSPDKMTTLIGKYQLALRYINGQGTGLNINLSKKYLLESTDLVNCMYVIGVLMMRGESFEGLYNEKNKEDLKIHGYKLAIVSKQFLKQKKIEGVTKNIRKSLNRRSSTKRRSRSKRRSRTRK